MTLSRYQLERTDLTVMLEQGRRVEGELFAENHRNLQTMGELLKARMFGSTEYAIGLRKRMTNYVQGAGRRGYYDATKPGRRWSETSAHVGDRPPPEPDPHPEHGVLCDCDACSEAVKRLLRNVGILPKGQPDRASLIAETMADWYRLKIPARYRRDESDR